MVIGSVWVIVSFRVGSRRIELSTEQEERMSGLCTGSESDESEDISKVF